ncbi:hypothetical protein [Actinophytocola sp.]|uniref:hypothetical protein n=1 Tax=Actinophytocola sp. TaxID=1872138 RepID=UPI002D7F0A14|nr:hypothetical protein [Actinophytocola sp.]HET9142933.1 hypothetical protein [Actinophytocola sp.]
MRRSLSILATTALLVLFPPAAMADPGWTPVTPAPAPPANLTAAGLFDVAAVSPADVWAVGGGWTDTEQALIMHWTGAGWSPVQAPSVRDFQYSFTAVDVVSARDVWAAGNGMPVPAQDFRSKAVLAHYDGTAWSMARVPAPPSSSSDVLTDIDMVSATDGWAVGWRVAAPADPFQPLAMRWRNGRWDAVRLPRIGGGNVLLGHVHARTGTDVWAVGSVGDAALILHFDGTRWRRFDVPHGGAPGATNELRAVTTVSANEAWAAGSACRTLAEGVACQPLILRLTGGRWQVVPPAGDGGTNLLDVVARSGDDVWVVGYDLPIGGQEANHVEHWDGRRFVTVPAYVGPVTVQGGLASALEGVTRLPGTDELWAVGWQDGAVQAIRHG